MLHAVIMAGGSGTRFWPQSRRSLPKQLQPLVGTRTLLQQTADRLGPLVPTERTWVVTNAGLAEETRRQLPAVPATQVFGEPQGRNTAPCIGLAAIRLLAVDPEAVMLVLPADHVITPAEAFRTSAETAAELVLANPRRLVLFGISPSHAATGFGYIQQGEPLDDIENGYHVASFREKPDANAASGYVESGDFFWNCGIFAWRADRVLALLEEYEPEMHQQLALLREQIGQETYEETLATEFPRMTSISIDHAVLERAPDVCVLAAPFEWDDVGHWQALARVTETDEEGNSKLGSVVTLDAGNCIVRSTADHLVAVVGVDELVIVHTPDATLVARGDDEEGLRRLVQVIEEQGLDEYL